MEKDTQEIKDGYVGKAKGIKQIVYERGFFTMGMFENGDVSVEGVRKDENGRVVLKNDPAYANAVVDKTTSLRYILESCEDFKNELSRL